MPLPADHVVYRCQLCDREVRPLLHRYLWLGAGWRGRPVRKPHCTSEVLLCGPCGDLVLDRLGPLLPRQVRLRLNVPV